jgi:hypothetical protein
MTPLQQTDRSTARCLEELRILVGRTTIQITKSGDAEREGRR